MRARVRAQTGLAHTDAVMSADPHTAHLNTCIYIVVTVTSIVTKFEFNIYIFIRRGFPINITRKHDSCVQQIQNYDFEASLGTRGISIVSGMLCVTG